MKEESGEGTLERFGAEVKDGLISRHSFNFHTYFNRPFIQERFLYEAAVSIKTVLFFSSIMSFSKIAPTLFCCCLSFLTFFLFH